LKKILSKVKEKPDILISCGDLSFFGRGLDKVCKELNEIGLQILSIHGNHEGSEEMKRMYKKYKNFTDIHSGILEIDNFVFFGYGGGGFTKIDERFETIVRKVEREISKDKKLIFISHMPPYKTKLDYLDLDHVGSKSYRKFIEKNKFLGIEFINYNGNRREPVALNAELSVDYDGIIYLEAGLSLEQNFLKMKNDFFIADSKKVTDINTYSPTRFNTFYSLSKIYGSSKNEKLRRIIMNNINLGIILNRYFLKKRLMHCENNRTAF